MIYALQLLAAACAPSPCAMNNPAQILPELLATLTFPTIPCAMQVPGPGAGRENAGCAAS